ncbi:ABC transporter ATP-binding protein [Zunongwangia sp. HGR-M22]|uniref:ABC transporter ATP-binding protein n=1 Tax=Zunongwangia sp. HGR-M22 TaxID=3015168 RepID=UPI0022DDF531|nr:ABC transporter ATP-binding protein [Zunongwangia sp. HGR-M22]WBL24871.1 ABC transporter ATP-binding protein [Zunongwangia sp. HGR-M22]
MSVILKAENISKQYRLGTVGTGTLSHDLNRWWHQIRGKEDPYLKVGAVNDRSAKASEDYVWALRDINFEVKPGEVLGIIGKNGAGKSTLLKLLSRITAPTTGSIKTRGRIASLLEVGTGFHPELTGRENIFLNGAILGMTKTEIRSKIDEIIAFSGCEMYIDTPVKRYSSGMRVRLGFAVAAHLEPEILVVDEVLAVGDAEFQKKAIGKMQDLSTGEGRTVLFVSHNMASVKSLCTRGMVLENGGTVFQGNIEQAISNYLSSKDQKFSFNNSGRVKKSNKIGIQNLRILNEYNTEIETILSGETLYFEIKLNASENLNSLHIGLGIYSNEEIPQFHCSTETLNQPYFNIEKGEKTVYLKIPKWPLASGSYYLNIYLRYENETIDYVKEAVWIKSEKGDFYNTGFLPNWNKGFMCEYEWK